MINKKKARTIAVVRADNHNIKIYSISIYYIRKNPLNPELCRRLKSVINEAFKTSDLLDQQFLQLQHDEKIYWESKN